MWDKNRPRNAENLGMNLLIKGKLVQECGSCGPKFVYLKALDRLAWTVVAYYSDIAGPSGRAV
jgi:hypothetical protein